MKVGCHGHGSPLNLIPAIGTSCNGFFCWGLYYMLNKKEKYGTLQNAMDTWRDYMVSMGFGYKLGIDLPGEKRGMIPNATFYDKAFKHNWNALGVISIAIGQGEVTLTPLQIANLCATVANRGFYYIPHIIKDSPGIEIDPKYKERVYPKVDSSYFNLAVQGMYMAVNGGGSAGGTAFSAAIPGKDVCGKTGTAQNPRGADNSVFICFAPKDDPKIAVAAYIENAGFGATWACPIASLLIEKYLKGSISRPDMEKRVLEGDLMARVKTD
jgi:penicillin-binding protein 2